ncbi:MAG TPA: hypothetical protein VGC11_07180 [Acidimicrobiia bacterium]|jgi:hypothetical protein
MSIFRRRAEQASTTGDDAGHADDEPNEVAWDLTEWEPALRREIGGALTRAGIPHRWFGQELVVALDDEEAVESILDETEFPDQIPVERVGDGELVADQERASEAMSNLFLSADRLCRDPRDAVVALRLIEMADAIRHLPPPYGFTATWWEVVAMRAALLQRDVIDRLDDGRIRASATTLRDLLRPVV